jgi:hypothetical protein
MAGRYEQQYYGKGGSPTSKWRTPMLNPELFKEKEGGEGWVSWGLALVGAGSAKKKPEVPLHADGNPLNWARRYPYDPQHPLQQRLGISSSTGSSAPQQHGQPSAAHQTPTSRFVALPTLLFSSILAV